MYISLQPVDPWNDILSDRTVGSILNCDYYYKSFLLLVFFDRNLSHCFQMKYQFLSHCIKISMKLVSFKNAFYSLYVSSYFAPSLFFLIEFLHFAKNIYWYCKKVNFCQATTLINWWKKTHKEPHWNWNNTS